MYLTFVAATAVTIILFIYHLLHPFVNWIAYLNHLLKWSFFVNQNSRKSERTSGVKNVNQINVTDCRCVTASGPDETCPASGLPSSYRKKHSSELGSIFSSVSD